MAALAEWFRYRSVEPGTRVRVPYVALLYGKIGVMVHMISSMTTRIIKEQVQLLYFTFYHMVILV